MTQFTGALFGGQVQPDVARAIVLVHEAQQMPIYAELIGRGLERVTNNEKFSWFTKSLAGRRTLINSAVLDQTSTAIPVDDGSVFFPNSVILFEATNEVALVTAVATNTLTVVRSIGAVAASAASVADNSNVRNIGHADGEGSGSPTANMAANTEVFNYVQTFRKTVDLSGRALRIKTLTDDERASQREKKFHEIQEDIEQSILFGGRGVTTDANGRRVTTSGGIYENVTTNIDNVAGAMSKTRLNAAMQLMFSQGSSLKYGFAGPTFVEAIYTIFENKLQTRPDDAVQGLRITDVNTPYGILRLMTHRGLKGAFAQDCVVVDPRELSLRFTENPRAGGTPDRPPLSGRLHLREQIQNNDADGEKDEWFAELGVQFGAESTHGIVRGVTGGA